MTMEALKLFPKSELINIWQEKTIRLATRISFVILFFSLSLLLLTWKNLPPQLPLFYSLPWGEEQLGKPVFLLILPLSSLFWGTLNFFLAIFSFEKHPLAAKFLVWITASIVFLASITLFKIIFLIT